MTYEAPIRHCEVEPTDSGRCPLAELHEPEPEDYNSPAKGILWGVIFGGWITYWIYTGRLR